jgi:hypothetical protein
MLYLLSNEALAIFEIIMEKKGPPISDTNDNNKKLVEPV